MKYRHVLPAIALSLPAPLPAQPSYLDLTANNIGIAVGDAPRVTGLRINFRDRYLERANGVNITLWTPYEPRGEVRGIAVGLPATGARRTTGSQLGWEGSRRRTGCEVSPSGRSARVPVTKSPAFSLQESEAAAVVASPGSRSLVSAWGQAERSAA